MTSNDATNMTSSDAKSTKPIKAIAVTLLAPMSDHIANGGEKLLGNAASIKRRPDGRVYISGQMQRHALFSAIERLNWEDPERGDTYVANGDAPSTNIAHDLRSDLGGFLDTNKGDYSGRRTAPLTATPAVAVEPSTVGRDLLIRIKMNENEDSERKQALATNEFSEQDQMHMSFFLDLSGVGVSKHYTYEKEQHTATQHIKHVADKERARRARLFLEATRSLTDYANQARNAVSGEPQKVLIVLDTKLSRKAVRYFAPGVTAAEQKNILKELDERGARYYFGDDTATEGKSVFDAYKDALTELSNGTIYDPTGGAEVTPAE